MPWLGAGAGAFGGSGESHASGSLCARKGGEFVDQGQHGFISGSIAWDWCR